MGKGRKKKIIITLIALVIIIAGFGLINSSKSKKSEGMTIETVNIIKNSIESHVQTSGEVLSIQKRDITSDISGKVSKIDVEKGEKVSEGQVLLKLDDSEIRYQLKQAEIKLAIERESLNELKKGDKLELEINLSNAQIQYDEAKRSYEQTKELFNQGAVSSNELNISKNKLDQANNNLILAKKNLDNTNNSSKITIQEKQMELSRLSVEKLKEELDKYIIKSPINGTVVEINEEEGSVLSPTIPVMVVMDTEQLEIISNISEYEVDQVKIGDSVTITSDAIEGQEYKGTVKYIAPTAVSVASGQGKETVVEVKVGVNGDSGLKPGFSAAIDILTEIKEEALVVPYEAIFTRKDGQKIIFSVQDGKAKAHEIKTGIESDLVVEVIGKDIKENDKIILNPTENIKDGDPINIDQVMEQ